MKRFFEIYFTAWWLPSLVYLGLLAGFSGVALSTWRPLVVAANCLTGVMGIALLGLFAVSIRHFIKKQWSSYSVQHVEEGKNTVLPEMSKGNELDESRLMVECGGVWVELFEQSNNLERRVTKATMDFLEKEFAEFLANPKAAVAKARGRSRELAKRLAGTSIHGFRLLTGMQPGIYTVAYSLNPGEAGSVYLKAFEVTQGTPLSAAPLEEKSKTRMTWSSDPGERFGAKAGFTIYEGDWGKPYAARFEVWFNPDSGSGERKLAGRVFKIEGWQH